MTSGGNDHRRVDGVGVHAALVVVVHRHEGPVGHDTGDAYTGLVLAVFIRARDEVLDGGGVEELDVVHSEHAGQDGAREESGVLDDNVVTFVLEGHSDLAQEHVGGLPHHHSAEELPAQPRATSRADSGLDHRDAQVRPQLAQRVGRRQAARAGADDDDVGLGMGVKVGKVF